MITLLLRSWRVSPTSAGSCSNGSVSSSRRGFYAAGTAGPITVSAPCSVLMREDGGTLTVAVSDPTRHATTVTVTLDRTGYTAATGGPEITVLGTEPITIVAEVGGSHGASRVVTFGTGPAIATAEPHTLAPEQDAHVRDGSYAGDNFGSASQLEVKRGSAGYTRRVFVKFDLASLPATPRRAVLWVRGRVSDSSGTQAEITPHAVAGDAWTEAGITWNNQPTLGAALDTAPVGHIHDWVSFDVTDFVATQYANDQEVTLGLAQPAVGAGVYLYSRSASAAGPFLQVIT